LDGRVPIRFERIEPRARETVVFQGQRETLVGYVLSLDPARWVGGYTFDLELVRGDGTRVHGMVGASFVHASPRILALGRDEGSPGERLHIITQNVHGKAVVLFWEKAAGSKELQVLAGPVNADYPGLGVVQVLEVLVPSGVATGEVTVQVHAQVSNPRPFTVTMGGPGSGGGGGAGAPRIFLVLPSSGPSLMPIGIGGSNFGTGAIPWFRGAAGSLVPGAPILSVSLQNFPLLGSISSTVIFVPAGTALGSSAVQIEYLGNMSNPFPLSIY
jgi:hypothetical protein